MEKFVELIVKELVQNKEEVKIETITKETNFSVIKITVADSDMGKVIGKNGKIANAIRDLVKSASSGGTMRYFVQIGEK